MQEVEVREQRSTLNKGFSLVELIVVIAIMAVLVGVIASQFVKYVGQSKETSDKSNVDNLQSTANIVLADPTLTTISAGSFVITPGANGAAATVSDGVGGNFKSLLEDALGKDAKGQVKYPTINATDKTSYTITVTAATNGGYSAAVTLTGSGAGGNAGGNAGGDAGEGN